MALDTVIFLAFIFSFFTTNIFGWGILHENLFFVFSAAIGIIYLLMDTLKFFKQWQIVIKISLILLYSGVSIFLVTGNLIQLRHNSLDTNYINDSALQTEIAGRFVLLGFNPYVKDYDNTSLMKLPYKDQAGRTINPAVYHNVIPPFLILTSSAGYRVFARVFGFFDVRLIFLLALFSVIALGFVKFRMKQALLLFLILICLNPVFSLNLIQGTNDIVIVAFLLWSLFFLEKKNIFLSAILLGISLATKQTAWFAFPFYLFYAFQSIGKKKGLQFLLIGCASGFVWYLPFLLNNFPHTFGNLIFYPSSHAYSDTTTHPIEGFGFSQLLYSLGFIKSIYANFPFWLFQVSIGVLLLPYLLLSLKKNLTGSKVLLATAVLTGIVWFFNRYFLESHLAYVSVLAAAAFIWNLPYLSTRRITKR